MAITTAHNTAIHINHQFITLEPTKIHVVPSHTNVAAMTRPYNEDDEDDDHKDRAGIVASIRHTCNTLSDRMNDIWRNWTISSLGSRASLPCLKPVMKRYRALDSETRERLLFAISTTVGTILFLLLFECLYRINSYQMEDPEQAFSISYAVAYLISVVWQHALNRWMVFSRSPSAIPAPYCWSLCQTYVVYSSSLLATTLSGAILVGVMHMSPRLVTAITLPSSGLCNYFMLRHCVDDGSNTPGPTHLHSSSSGSGGNSNGSSSIAIGGHRNSITSPVPRAGTGLSHKQWQVPSRVIRL